MPATRRVADGMVVTAYKSDYSKEFSYEKYGKEEAERLAKEHHKEVRDKRPDSAVELSYTFTDVPM